MRTRLKVILPLAIAGVLLVVCVLLRLSQSGSRLELAALYGALAMLVLTFYQLERLVWQRWRRLHRAVRGVESTTSVDPDNEADVSQLAAAAEQWRAQLQQTQTRLAQERTALHTAQQALQEADERYMLAVRGASEGLWAWDLKTGETYFSPLWKSVLGYDDDEIGNQIDEWHRRIHPEDSARVLREMEDHLAGHTPQFENEHRLLHKDQSWHWVHARGTAIRHADGAPYRVIGLHSDITSRRAAEQTLIEVVDALTMARGETCFPIIARSFAQVMGVREAFVCEPCDNPPTKARMLAWWCDGQFLPNVEYDLEGTPCKNPQVLGRTCYCSKGLEEQWPLEKPFDRTSYLGIPVRDATGNIIGHIACTDNKPMPERTPHLAIFKLFAERVGLELERRDLLRSVSVLPANAHAGVAGGDAVQPT